MGDGEISAPFVALFNDNKFIVTYPKVDPGFMESETYIIWESLKKKIKKQKTVNIKLY